jgi:hypothetical protein
MSGIPGLLPPDPQSRIRQPAAVCRSRPDKYWNKPIRIVLGKRYSFTGKIGELCLTFPAVSNMGFKFYFRIFSPKSTLTEQGNVVQ